MKKCFKCSKEKIVSEFYCHPTMADGRLGKCKECTRSDVLANRIKNLDRIRAYDRSRGSRQSKNEKSRQGKKYRRDFPLAYVAGLIYQNAVRRGGIERLPCVRCGSMKSHGHHEDYRKPLALIWLCPIHHRERHAEIKSQGINIHAKF